MASVAKREWSYKGEAKTSFVVRYTDQSGKRRLKTFSKKKDADEYRRKVEREIEGGFHTPDRETMTVREAAEEYLKDCERRRKIGDNMTGQSLANYRSAVDLRVLPKIGNVKLNNLTSDQIQALVDEYSVKYAWRSLRTVHCVLRQILAFAVRRKWLKRNVLVDEPIRLPEKPKDRVAVPTKEELRAILKALTVRRPHEKVLSHYNRIAIVMLGMFCGMRKGEMLGLQWGDVDFDKSIIRVRHSLSKYDGLKAPKTKSGERDIPMPDQVRAALLQIAAYRSQHAEVYAGEGTRGAKKQRLLRLIAAPQVVAGDMPSIPDGFVLVTPSGRPLHLNSITVHLFHPLLKAAGVWVDGDKPPYTIHSLRHAAASLMIEQGLPPMHLKAVVGHSSVRTTYDVYGHLFPEDGVVRRAVDSIAAEFDATRARHSVITP